jgi:hypothetical protein
VIHNFEVTPPFSSFYTEIAQGIYFPYIKCQVHHLRQQAEEEYIGIQPFAPIPPLYQWSTGRQQMEWPPVFKGPGRPPASRSVTPPPLLFFRCSKSEKQQAFFFIWMSIRRSWLQKLMDSPYDTPERQRFYLTHQEWRQILSGERFKKAARKSDSDFLLHLFWLYDPFLWECGDIPQEISPFLDDHTRLSPDHFVESNKHSFNLKRMLCYDIALTHIKFQFEETDEIFQKDREIDAETLDKRRRCRSTLFRTSLSIPTTPPAWESTDPSIRTAWFEEFRSFLRDWPPVYPHRPLCHTPLTDLKEPVLSQQIVSMLAVYYTGVIRSLGTIPTMMWTYPGERGLNSFVNI